jgi:hypothetical protein
MGRPRDEDPLANADLSGVFDAVNPRQLLVGRTVGFADPKQGLPSGDCVINPVKPRLGNRFLRSATPGEKQNENKEGPSATRATYSCQPNFPHNLTNRQSPSCSSSNFDE